MHGDTYVWGMYGMMICSSFHQVRLYDSVMHKA
jgi:hypothetical protein